MPAAGAGAVQAVILAAVMPQTSPSVLVIRLDAIGDALALTPLLAELRNLAIPVDVVLRAVNADTFSSRAVRAVYVAPFALRSSTASNRDAIAAFGARLSKNAYTHALVATEDPGGYRLARAVGAPQRTGFVNGWGKPFKTLWAQSMLTRAVPRSAGLDRNAPHECEVLWKLGASLVDGATISRDPVVLRPLILDAEIPRGTHIAFQVSDKWERLGMDFTQVVRALRAASELGTVRAVAAASERDYAQRIAGAAQVPVERYASLGPWKEAVAGAAALVAPDSGAIHVAGMVGTPTVAVYPPILDLDLQIARWAPWAAPYRSISAEGNWSNEVAVSLRELLAP
ncbi:MAG TPA: glycosyltransferase family 9 protein [Verrucomicrobiae bacterium]|nr:glycosyltransferase family 9 protein [Verrucomicrobiae bacterium]